MNRANKSTKYEGCGGGDAWSDFLPNPLALYTCVQFSHNIFKRAMIKEKCETNNRDLWLHKRFTLYTTLTITIISVSVYFSLTYLLTLPFGLINLLVFICIIYTSSF